MGSPREKREIAQSEARDKAAKMIAGLVPMGSAAYELITTLVAPLHEKKKREFINDLATRLKRLESQGQIDLEELAQNEEFNTIITKAILLAQQNHQKEKLEALRNVVVNASVKLPKNVIEFSEMEYFLRIIETITPLHILLLSVFKNPKEITESKGIELGRMMTSNSQSTLYKIYPELKEKAEFVNMSWKDLHDFSLVQTDSLKAMVSGNAAIEPLTTPLGNKFLEMIEFGE